MVIIRGNVSPNSEVKRYYYKNETSAWFGIHRLNDDGEIIVGRGVDEKGFWVEVLL